MKYAFHPEAETEFLETAARYEAEVPRLGELFSTEVSRAIELLLRNPGIGAPIVEELRHFVLRRFPYSIIYADAQAFCSSSRSHMGIANQGIGPAVSADEMRGHVMGRR